MRTTLLGFFDDCELARLARADLILGGLPVDRISVTAVQGLGQSRFRATSGALDKVLASLRALFKNDRDPANTQRLIDRVERGAATVFAHTHNAREAQRVTAVFKTWGVTEIAHNNQKVSSPRSSRPPPTRPPGRAISGLRLSGRESVQRAEALLIVAGPPRDCIPIDDSKSLSPAG